MRSDLFAQEAKPQVAAFVRDFHELPRGRRRDEIVAVHLSMGNDSLDAVRELPLRRIVIYHNITPARFFEGLSETNRHYARLGRQQLKRYAKVSELGIGDSEFNRGELAAMGFGRTAVVPILIDWAAYDVEPDAAVARMLADERTDILVVGQILPQKAVHDVIAAFARYREGDRAARLHLVGSTVMSGGYLERLRREVSRLGLDDAVHFAGSVSMEELVAYYRGASVLLTLSDHEGFCVPLVEAMRFDLPIVAHAAGAIPETAGGAAILLAQKTPDIVARALERAIGDRQLRASLVEQGRTRLQEFQPQRVGARLREALASADLALPEARRRRFVVVSSAERTGIHHYADAVCDGLRANGHEAIYLGVNHADDVDLAYKFGLIRPDTAAVVVEHESGIFPHEWPFIRALASLRRRGIPVVLSLHELEPGKFASFRAVGDVIHYRMRFRPPLEVIRTFYGVLNLIWRFTRYRVLTVLLGAVASRIVTHSRRSREWVELLSADRRKTDDFPLVLTPLENADLPTTEEEKRALRERLGLPVDRFIFVSPGFFFRRKRYLEVISVLPDDAYLVLSGTESEWDPRYLDEVRAFLAERGVTNVKIDTRYEAMGDNVAASDAIVLFYQDVFQSAIATQAIWAEIPAIYSDVSGFALYAGAGLVARDPAQLREAMEEIGRAATRERLQRQIRILRRMLAPERQAPRYVAGLRLKGGREREARNTRNVAAVTGRKNNVRA